MQNNANQDVNQEERVKKYLTGWCKVGIFDLALKWNYLT